MIIDEGFCTHYKDSQLRVGWPQEDSEARGGPRHQFYMELWDPYKRPKINGQLRLLDPTYP